MFPPGSVADQCVGSVNAGAGEAVGSTLAQPLTTQGSSQSEGKRHAGRFNGFSEGAGRAEGVISTDFRGKRIPLLCKTQMMLRCHACEDM